MFVLAKIWKLGGTDDYFCSVVVVTSSSQLPPAHGVKFCRWSTRGLACSQIEQAKSLAAVCVVCAGSGDCSYVKHDQEKFLFKIWWVNNPGIEIFHFPPIWNSTNWHTVWNWYHLPWAALDMDNQRGWLCRRGRVMQSGDGHELFIFIKALVILQAWILVILFMFAQNYGSESAALKSTCWLSCWHFEGFWLDFTLVLSNSLTTQEGKRVYTLVASHCVVIDALICIHNMRVHSKPLQNHWILV
jgi:hypothetical protein